MTAEQEKARSWVGTAKTGASASGYGDWKYVTQGSGSVEITAPKENGSYDVRFYQGFSANDANLVKSASVSFTVDGTSAPAAPTPTPTPTPKPTTPPSGNIDPKLIGEWRMGGLTEGGGAYNPQTGRYEGVSGIGTIRTFYADGTYTVYYSVPAASVTTHERRTHGIGKYSAEKGVIKITDIVVEVGAWNETPDGNFDYIYRDKVREDGTTTLYYLIETSENGQVVLRTNTEYSKLNDNASSSFYKKMN